MFIALSLDDFIARDDGSLERLSRVERPGEDDGYGSFFAAIDSLVIGRNTYDTVMRRWGWPSYGIASNGSASTGGGPGRRAAGAACVAAHEAACRAMIGGMRMHCGGCYNRTRLGP